MKKTFSIAAIVLAMIAGEAPNFDAETVYKTVEVGPATLEIERTGSQVSMHVEHELYSRNNINPSWRTLFQVPNQGFQCLFEYSWGCDLDKKIKGDLVQ